MEASTFYVLSFYGFIAFFIIHRVRYLLLPFIQLRLAQYVIYPLLFPSRRWGSLTRLQAVICCIYILGNATVLLFPFSPFPTLSVIQKRAAVTALVNLLPSVIGKQILSALNVFLLSSRSLHLAHSLISLTSLCEGLLHSAIIIHQNLQKDQVITSGYSVFAISIVFIFSSFWIFQRLLRNYFLSLHFILAIALLSTLVWHTILIPALFYRITSIICSLVFTSTLSIYLLRRTSLRTAAVVEDALVGEDVVVVKLRTGKLNQFSYYPEQPIWYNEGGKDLVFFLSNKEKHSRRIRFIERGQQVHLSSPYGTDFRLQEYDEVILLAKGTGILAVLSYALTLCRRRNYDDEVRRDILQLQNKKTELTKKLDAIAKPSTSSSPRKREKIDALSREIQLLEEQIKDKKQIPLYNDTLRRVDLLWIVEKGSQADWAMEPFKELRKLDPKNRLILVWCLYPNQRHTPMFEYEASDHWQCFWPGPSPADAVATIKLRIKERQSRVKGKMVVACCGEADFRRQLRTIIIESMQKARYIDFIEFDRDPSQVK